MFNSMAMLLTAYVPDSRYSENNYSLKQIAEMLQGYDTSQYADFVAQSFSGNAIYAQALNIFDLCKPIAATILAMMFMLELYNVTVRADNEGTRAFDIPFKTMIKCVICLTVFNATPQIMELLFSIPQQIVGALSVGSSANTSVNIGDIATQLDAMKLGERLLTAVLVTVVSLVYKFAGMVVKLVLLGRLIEIYVLFALAPLPMATIGNKDLNSVAKKFLKSFAAVCIQGAVLFIILAFYPALVAMATSSLSAVSDDVMAPLWTMLFSALVLVICIFGSSKYSKMICDAV